VLQLTMMRHGPGLAASPPVRNNLEVGGEYSPWDNSTLRHAESSVNLAGWKLSPLTRRLAGMSYDLYCDLPTSQVPNVTEAQSLVESFSANEEA
jgi:hypothetical protein